MTAIRGTPNDLWADTLLGQPDFESCATFPVVADRLWTAHGCVVDRGASPERLYVYDSGNNRILGLSLDKVANTPIPPKGFSMALAGDIVIGQPDFNSSAQNGDSNYQNYPLIAPASARSLSMIAEYALSVGEAWHGSGMWVDEAGALCVTDYGNNRVLKYQNPWSIHPAATDLWGQDNYTARLPNKGMALPDATSLNFGREGGAPIASVCIEANGNFWVCDGGNNRVVRFAPGSKAANLVLGQLTFTTNSPGSGANQLNSPLIANISPWTGKLYVADSRNNRVQVFTPPFSDGMAGTTFGSGFGEPAGIDFDPTEPNAVWICNRVHNTIELWDETTGVVRRTLGIRDDGWSDSPVGSLGIDSAGNIFLANGGSGTNVALYKKGGDDQWPIFVMGTAFYGNVPIHTAAKLEVPNAAVVSDGQLIVSDWGRILFWNNYDPATIATGQAADGVTGNDGAVKDFDSPAYGSQITMRGDKAHHIYVSVAAPVATPHISVYDLPLTTGKSPSVKLYPPFNALGGGQLEFPDGFGFAFDGLCPTPDGKFLWVAHPDSSRVFRIRDPLTNPLVDVVLGQFDLSSVLPNRGSAGAPTANMLKWAGSVAVDRQGNVWVSDHSSESRGNNRLLMFRASRFPTDNTAVIFAPDADKIFPDTACYQVDFDSKNRMVAGYNGYSGRRFPGVYNDPLGPSVVPDAFLKDYCSSQNGLFFDDQDNLTVVDGMRSRVFIYRQPLAAVEPPPPPPTPPSSPTLDRLTILPSSLTLRRGQSGQLQARVILTDGSSYDATALATWSSLNAGCTVSALGLVRAVKPGRATIVASLEGKAAFCSVKVTG